jgi:hypothetical protein
MIGKVWSYERCAVITEHKPRLRVTCAHFTLGPGCTLFAMSVDPQYYFIIIN